MRTRFFRTYIFLGILFFTFSCSTTDKQSLSDLPITPFEKSGGEKTATYWEAIEYYKILAEKSGNIQIKEWGLTDAGEPLHVVTYDSDGVFDIEKAKSQGKAVFLINNGIHPGEPCGIDASMLLLREIIENDTLKGLMDNIHLAIIPVFNIGGCLNRDTLGRVNQVGPESYGFRGNATNYNLNRDFTKLDTKNAWSFAEIFQHYKPDVFVDTHTSDGADYQYAMTLIATQPDALGEVLGNYYREVIRPELYKGMEERGFLMTPYVNSLYRTPDQGIQGFYDSPRYSSGYAALFNCLSFESESHMLKPFDVRVKATLAFLETMLNTVHNECETILEKKEESLKSFLQKTEFATNWELDTTRATQIKFLGYEPEYIQSPITSSKLLRYNQDKPIEKEISFYEYFKPGKIISKPKAYIIPQAWYSVINRLKVNKIQFYPLEKDTAIEVTWYKIADYKSYPSTFEGHYVHYQTKVEKQISKIEFRKGDVVVDTEQEGVRFILEMLEPESIDSYFNWNIFDPILEQKEYFGEYYFTLLAEKYLKENPVLAKELKKKQDSDPVFAQNNRAQLHFIYENSPYMERSYLRYPVYRVE